MLRVLLSLVVGCLCSAMALAEQPLRLMANTSPPYADVKLPEQGLAPELVRHIFARTDYQPEIVIGNWSRAVEGAQLGVYTGLAAAWYSAERDRDLMYSEPYLDSELILLKGRLDAGNYKTLADLAGGRLGVRTDYAYGIDFGAIPDLQLVQENHLIQNLLNLLNGSVDFVIGDRRTVTLQLHEYLKDRITEFSVMPIELPQVQRHVAISRSKQDHEQVVAAFNRALAAARKDGSLDTIVDKWDQRYSDIK